MIRPLAERDYDAVIRIVNQNWKNVYAGYVNPELLSDTGCEERGRRLKEDFNQQRLYEYVWEESNKILGLLSMGAADDTDRFGAFEIWRVYIAEDAQGRGIGRRLLAFAENNAKANGYTEIIIWTFSRNTRAIEFYQQCGYQVDKEKYMDSPYLAFGTRLLKYIL